MGLLKGGYEAPITARAATPPQREPELQSLLSRISAAMATGGGPNVDLPAYPEPAAEETPQMLDPAAAAAKNAAMDASKQGFLVKADKLYNAFQHAETGSEENPWIRTRYKPKGDISTAWGPVQITTTLMKDALERKDHLLSGPEERFAKRFISQGEKFMKAKDDHPVYGYGGTGFLKSKNDKLMYERVAKKLLLDAHLSSKEDLGKTIKKWRGMEDPNYERKVRAAFYKN